MTEAEYVELAKIEDLEGAIYSFCGEPNDHADDCGWWCTGQSPDIKYYCNACDPGTHCGER